VQLEGLGKLKKFNDFIGSRNHYFWACNIVPQSTMLLRAPDSCFIISSILTVLLINMTLC
jgi:hypothetical protein